MVTWHYTVDGKIEPICDDEIDDVVDSEEIKEISIEDALAHLLGGGLDNLMFSDDEEDDC